MCAIGYPYSRTKSTTLLSPTDGSNNVSDSATLLTDLLRRAYKEPLRDYGRQDRTKPCFVQADVPQGFHFYEIGFPQDIGYIFCQVLTGRPEDLTTWSVMPEKLTNAQVAEYGWNYVTSYQAGTCSDSMYNLNGRSRLCGPVPLS